MKKLNNLLDFSDFINNWKAEQQKKTKRTDVGLDVVKEGLFKKYELDDKFKEIIEDIKNNFNIENFKLRPKGHDYLYTTSNGDVLTFTPCYSIKNLWSFDLNNVDVRDIVNPQLVWKVMNLITKKYEIWKEEQKKSDKKERVDKLLNYEKY